MLNISTWTLENKTPRQVKDLPNAFLQRLWLLSPTARSPCCTSEQEDPRDVSELQEELSNGAADNHYGVNPLDLVTAVFMSANPFLQQEMIMHMLKCHFAVPLVIPNICQDEPSDFLLWPQRGAVSRWRSNFPKQSKKIYEGNLASTNMPMVSCMKLGHCNVSKSQVLNNVIRSTADTFLHRGLDGGELPRRLSNGLVEISWCLPTGDPSTDTFPTPLVISNLRGDAGSHEKCVNLLCQASSAMVVFCGDLKEKQMQILASCKAKTSNLIIINLSNENPFTGGFIQNINRVIQGGDLSEVELADKLRQTLEELLPDKVKCVTLEAVAKLAEGLAFHVDETRVCQKAMATAQNVLKGLEEGSRQYKEKQLPLQGRLWSKLAEIERKEHTKEEKEKDPHNKGKDKILAELNGYKMTQTMKTFSHALLTADKMERTFFLHWMKLRLQEIQSEKEIIPQTSVVNTEIGANGDVNENHLVVENGENFELEDTDSFCTDSTIEEEETQEMLRNMKLEVPESSADISQEVISTEWTADDESTSHQEESMCGPCLVEELHVASEVCCEDGTDEKEDFGEQMQDPQENEYLSFEREQVDKQQVHSNSSVQQVSCPQLWELGSYSISLEHFLFEMGLIFELEYVSHSRSRDISRFPGVAAELLLFGVPLQLMDGETSTIPIHWLGCVFAELKHCLPQEHCRMPVLTNLGVHHARNAAVLSALFAVTFPGRTSSKGIYMLILSVPDTLKEDIGFDFLLLIDVEGISSDQNRNISDHLLVTVAAGLSDILLLNISPHASDELESNLALIVNALLCAKECGSMPFCQFLLQGEGIHSVLQASQLKHVSDVLQHKTLGKGPGLATDLCAPGISGVPVVKGPWHSMSLSEKVDLHYSRDVLKLKQNLFGALGKCAATTAATNLSEFMGRLCAIWDAVRAESIATGLQNRAIALAFASLCTEFSQWQESFLEHTESWLSRTRQKIFATKANNAIHSGFVDEAEEEVKTEAEKLKSKVEDYFMNQDFLKNTSFKPFLLRNVEHLQEQVTINLKEKLKAIDENHCSATQLQTFEALLEKEQQSKLQAMIENSRSNQALLQDAQLEKEFEAVWSHILSNFDFRPSETEDITARVRNVLRENLMNRGLQKHLKKLDGIGQSQTPDNQNQKFYIHDEHFGYRSRLKHMFEDNNRLQKLEAQQLACHIIKQCEQFVEEKSLSHTDFSDDYIKDLLENVERGLKDKAIEIKSVFEVDLKIFLCHAACQDFQKLHDRYAKDRELLQHISANKRVYLAEFMYQFRKMDQCHHTARAFTSMVLRPTVLSYIHRYLAMLIADEVRGQAPQYKSQHAFHQSLLEELISEDAFENLVEYLHSFDDFRLRRLQERVVAHLSQSNNLIMWRLQRLGEIVGLIAAAVSEAAEGTAGVLSDAKPLLERVCLTLECDGDVEVTRAALDGPLFSITVKWDYFVTCLLELLAAMRLELAQEFTENKDAAQFLQNLPVQPHEYLLDRVKGCEKRCPICGTPCDVEELGHRVHGAVLHRPISMLPNKTHPLSNKSSPECRTNLDVSNETDGASLACSRLHYPEWIPCSEDPNLQFPSAYWRYCFIHLYAFNPAKIVNCNICCNSMIILAS